MEYFICELCRREGITKVTEHHLRPREQGGKYGATAWLCEDCHKQIHALYTNKELAALFYTIERLEKDEKIVRYLKYIRKQSPSKKINIKTSRNVRRKR